MPERVHVRHILLMTQGKPAADEAKIKAKAEDLLKQVRAGADFADLAKKNSEDPRFGAEGRRIHRLRTARPDGAGIRKGRLLAEARRERPGEDQYGYHIIQVLAHEEARLKPFAEVKDELDQAVEEAARQRPSCSRSPTRRRPHLQKDPLHPEKVAADLNMELVRADDVEAGKPFPEVGASPDFDQAVAGLKKGEVSQPVALPGNKMVLAVVTDVDPAAPVHVRRSEDQVHDTMVQARLTEAVQEHAKELMDKAQGEGRRPGEGRQGHGPGSEDLGRFRAHGHRGRPGLGQLLAATAFTQPDGTSSARSLMPDGTVVAKVVAHVPAGHVEAGRAARPDPRRIKSQKAPRPQYAVRSRRCATSSIKQGKIKVHQEVMQRLMASYRPATG